MKAGKTDPCLNLDEGGRTDEIVAHKLGIGSGKQYEKEKYIVEKYVYFAYLKFLYSPTSGGKSVFPNLET